MSLLNRIYQTSCRGQLGKLSLQYNWNNAKILRYHLLYRGALWTQSKPLNTQSSSTLRCLILHDSTLSSKNQCEALADALELKEVDRTVLHIPPNKAAVRIPCPFHILLSWVFANPFWGYPTAEAQLSGFLPPPAMGATNKSHNAPNRSEPLLVIGCGRRTAPLVCGVRDVLQRKRNQSVFAVQIHDPRCGHFLNRKCFDLIATPAHDVGATAEPYVMYNGNTFSTIGSLSRVNNNARTIPASPRSLVVLIGGPNSWLKPKDFRKHALNIIPMIESRLRSHSSLQIIGSRRTPSFLWNILAQKATVLAEEVQVPCSTWAPDINNSPNPYYDALNEASCILVTGDSVGMISDACSRPVCVEIPQFEASRKTNKFQRFIKRLEELGRVGDGCDTVPINDSKKVAQRVLEGIEPWEHP